MATTENKSPASEQQQAATQPTAPDQRLRLPSLIEYREAASVRRCEAFCDVPDYVLGIPVRPLTPATFSMLRAVGSHFVCGGAPTEGDVRNYLWFHSPDWCNITVKGWERRKARALAPLMRQLANPWRRRLGLRLDVPRYSATLLLAITDIRKIVEDAFADIPAASAGNSAPLACLEANLIHCLAKGYGWTPERTRATPLRQLFQLVRCIRASNGEDVCDAGEQQLLADHIRQRQAKLDAQKQAAN